MTILEQEYEATNDVVVIKQDDVEKKNAAGFLLATDSKEAPWRGTVLTFGEDVPADKLSVGQSVYFKKYAGHEVEIQGEKFMLVPYEDILLRSKKAPAQF